MDAAQRIATLVDWAGKHGAKLHPAVEVYEDDSTGFSFRVKPDADAPLGPYETIVSLPTSLTLSYLSALSDKGPKPFPKALIDNTAPHVIGRLFLIKEYLKGEDSFWWPYIQALPQPQDAAAWTLPAFWPADDAELLDGTNVEVGIEKIKRDVKREYKFTLDLLSAHSDDTGFKESVTPTLYHWAYCTFSSRSFRPSLVLSEAQAKSLPAGVGIDDFSVLLPLFDIGNHDMTTDIRWDLSDDASCELKVGRPHAPGQQVFNNYSMKTNAELLLGYGFMVPATETLHNDYTHVRKRTDTPVASEEYLISLRPLNHSSCVLGRSKQAFVLAESVPIISSFQHVPPDMVWDIFCTLAKPEQLDQLIPVGDGVLQNGHTDVDAVDRYRQEKFFSGQVGAECLLYLEQTVAVIQHKVLQELERLNETDVEVVSGDLTKNQKLALDYRERCRQVLESTLESIEADEILAAMDNGEAEEMEQ